MEQFITQQSLSKHVLFIFKHLSFTSTQHPGNQTFKDFSNRNSKTILGHYNQCTTVNKHTYYYLCYQCKNRLSFLNLLHMFKREPLEQVITGQMSFL